MVADRSVGPALTLGLGISYDPRIGSVLVNLIRDTRGFLGGSVRIDRCLSICICLRTYTGYSFSAASQVLRVLRLEIYRLSSSYRLKYRDGYRFDSAAVFQICWFVFGID